MSGYLDPIKCLALATLVGATAAQAADRHPVTGDPLAADQTFVYRLVDAPASLDPQLSEDVAGSEILRDLFEGLLNQDADGNIEPGVALGFSTNAAKSVFTFYLRDTARWSNGDPVTAADFVYAWQRAVDPQLAAPYAWFMELSMMENASEIVAGRLPPSSLGVTAIDDHTLEVRLLAPARYFPQMLTHPTTFPVHRATVETNGSGWISPDTMVSNGAYVLREMASDGATVRVRNPLYWNDAETIIDRVEARVIPSDADAFISYLKGDLDRTEIPSGLMTGLRRKMPREVSVSPRLCSYYYNINMTGSGHPALRDARVRRALSLALDRNVITERILQGGQFPAYTFTPEATAGFFAPEVEATTLTQPQRNARAKALMAGAGYTKGLKLDLTFNTSQGHKNIARAIAAMWFDTLGVSVTLIEQPWETFLETRGAHKFDIARAGWCGDYNEASTFLDLMRSSSGYNDAGYSNPVVDDLLEQARISDAPEALYQEVERLVAQDVPIIPIYHYSTAYLLDSDVGNWPTDNIEMVWYSKNLYKIAE